MDIQVQDIAHHRNGICGAPFYAVRFRWQEEGEHFPRLMLGIVFPVELGDCVTAVLDVDMLMAGDVAFGSNSWRGDHFDGPLRQAILDKTGEVW
jgi:hypothetical protein